MDTRIEDLGTIRPGTTADVEQLPLCNTQPKAAEFEATRFRCGAHGENKSLLRTIKRRKQTESPEAPTSLPGRASATETRAAASKAWGEGYECEICSEKARYPPLAQGSLCPVGVLDAY